MTFTDLKGKVKDYCNLSSTEADTRIGKSINAVYRRITSTLGLDAARFVTRSKSMTIGVATVTFDEIEKIDRLLDTTTATAIRLLQETTLHEIRSNQPSTGQPDRWALQNTDADSVTVRLDTVPQTAYSLQADGWTTLADLSGTDEPVFPESFHDILAWSVISEELLKKEKDKLAATYHQKATALLAELRFHLADSPTRETVQGSSQSAFGASGGSGGGNQGGSSYTQSGLVTFDRSGLAPFAVASGSAKVANLDADLLDGLDWNSALTFGGIANTGLKVLDTDASHALVIAPGSNLTANRTLTITTGDAARTLTLTGNLTGDQDVSSTASPTFVNPVVTSITTANTGLKILDTNASHVLSIVPGSNITANRALTLTTGDADRTLTLSGNPTLADWFDQSVKIASTPTFGATTITGALTISGAGAGQVVFPATQNAAAGGNTLDDYEEGTWTPSDTSGAALSFTTVEGHYVKIGQLVVAACTLTFPATANGANASIGGLPFTVQNSTNAIWGSTINFTSEATLFSAQAQRNSTDVLLYTSGGARITNAIFTTDTIRFTAIYRATA